MAPRRPRADAEATKKPSAKRSNNGVVKRSAQGYHTFKNGMLNVSPKGTERELVKTNQASPLLSLPPEIRNRIWHLVLGGMSFRDDLTIDPLGRFKMLPEVRARANTFALLRTCRQIYAETALLPITANALSFNYFTGLGPMIRQIRKFQRSHVQKVDFEIVAGDVHFPGNQQWLSLQFSETRLTEWFPNLQRINIRVFPSPALLGEAEFSGFEAFLRAEITPRLIARGYQVTVEKMSLTLREYGRQWRKVDQAEEEEV